MPRLKNIFQTYVRVCTGYTRRTEREREREREREKERERERERILDVARNGSDNRGRGTVPFDSILSQSFSRINPHGESNNR